MSKGKWFSTRDNILCARNTLINDPGIASRAELVKAVMKAQGISYTSANYAVNKASARFMHLFEKLTPKSESPK